MKIDVSVILVNYNTESLLKQCLLSIYEKTRGVTFEIIVSDNGSADGSISMLKRDFPEIIIIQNKANLGFGKANNRAIDKAVGKYILLLNTDTYLENNALSIFFNYMEMPENHMVACCGGDLFDANGNKQASYGNFPSVFDAISQLGFYKFYKNYYNKHVTGGVLNTGDLNIDVDYLCGADMFLRKSILDLVGTFDEDFFLYYEETELSYRIKKAGFRSVLLPGAKIVHLEGGSQDESKFNFFKISVFAKSRGLYFKKTSGALTALLIKVVFVMQSIILCLIRRNANYWKQAIIIFKS